MASCGIFAQKSYILVRASNLNNQTKTNDIHLSGNLPSDMQNSYYGYYLADIMNNLSENGYDLEYCGDNTCFIFTKGTSNSASVNTEPHYVRPVFAF